MHTIEFHTPDSAPLRKERRSSTRSPHPWHLGCRAGVPQLDWRGARNLTATLSAVRGPRRRCIAGSTALATCTLLCGSTPMMTMFCDPSSDSRGNRGRHADFEVPHPVSPLLSQSTAVLPAGSTNPGRANQMAADGSRVRPTSSTRDTRQTAHDLVGPRQIGGSGERGGPRGRRR